MVANAGDDEEFHDAESAGDEGEDFTDAGSQDGCDSGGGTAGRPDPAAYPLHRAAFDNNAERLREVLPGCSKEQLRELDTQGNTALHVALLRRNEAAVRALLDGGAPCHVRNARGWAPLYEAVQQQDRALALLVMSAELAQSRAALKAKKQRLVDTLHELPDLTMQLRWELSSTVPGLGLLLRRYAPHDTYTLWKVGSMLRVDGSLMGLDSKNSGVLPAWKRGHFSLLYDGRGEKHRALFVNHGKKEYWDVKALHKHVTKTGEATTAEAEVDTLMAGGADVAVTKMKTSEFKLVPVAGWLRGTMTEKVEGWKTKVFDVSGKFSAQERVKATMMLPLGATFEEYLTAAAPPPDLCIAKAVQNPLAPPTAGADDFASAAAADGYAAGDRPGPSAAGGEEGDERDGGRDGGASASISGASGKAGAKGGGGKADVPKKPKRFKGRCWMADEFPMSLHQLLPLLDVIGTANKHMAKASKFMSKFGDMDMFPVKVRVPLAMTVYALLSFKQFKVLDAKTLPGPGFFDVPDGFTQVDIHAPGRLKVFMAEPVGPGGGGGAAPRGAGGAAATAADADRAAAAQLSMEELLFDD